MRRHRRIVWTGLVVTFLLFAGLQHAIAADNDLNLDELPPGSGGPLPNVLIAVDNSASMDSELLFPTTNGYLYWNPNASGPYRFVDSNGSFYSDDISPFISFTYLFPNGCDDDGYTDRQIYCPSQDNFLNSFDHAVPPIGQFGFARSPTYNKAYFNPSVTYSPWIGYPNANPSNAFSDPSVGVTSMDLTQDLRDDTEYHRFLVGPGMTIGENVPININGSWNDNHAAITYSDQDPYQEIGIQYFPATFYLPADQPLPANYSQYNGTVFDGLGPQGQPMLGYQIRPSNFTDDAAGKSQYQAAIQNFANWYSYHRKRNLSIRGAVTTAFERVPKVRVADTTINQATDREEDGNFDALTMLNLTNPSARQTFQKSIYQMNFHSGLGTPNRQAVLDLGKELENNKSIIQSSCQRNYAILFTDGFNDGQVSGIGDLDGDGYSNAMSDIATRFYKDLKPPANAYLEQGKLPIPAGCPSPSLDCNPNLHMTTFGVTIGLDGPIFGNTKDFPEANANPYEHTPPWYLDENLQKIPEGDMPAGGSFEIDDLWHATLDSHGELLNAQSQDELVDRFTQTLTNILDRESTLTNATANSRQFAIGTDVYQTSYSPANWSGDLIAYDAVNGNASKSGREWSAAAELTGFTNPGQDNRLILTDLRTTDSDSGGQVQGVRFATDPISAKFPSLDSRTIFYLRGYRGDEQSNGGPYRNRGTSGDNTVLGDIVHSVPTYVGPPNPATYAGPFRDALYPDKSAPENKAPYYNPSTGTGFAATYASRIPIVYVGANDGMLHGFDAKTGQEKIAFIPNALLDKIGAPNTGLQSPDYVHQYFVDGQTTAGPVFINHHWQTMLVGGLRSGGRTIYALDVTNPADFNRQPQNVANIVKWEFKDPGLGLTYGKPIIARLHNGQWAAIFGNGYNSQQGGARLYIVNIATGALIRELDVPSTGSSPSGPNGLASPTALDLDNDRITDYVYAGDFQGHLWKFDLTSDDPSQWHVSRNPLFTAVSADGKPQPITTAPVAIPHPYGNQFGAMIYIGTGQDILATDDQSRGDNSIYGIWDPDVFTTSDAVLSQQKRQNWEVTRSQLLQQSVLSTQSMDNRDYRLVSDKPINFGTAQGQYRGWVLDLPANGEAILDQPTAVSRTSRLEFTTTIRDPNACETTRSGFVMALDLASGGAPSANVFDVNGDGVINDKDLLTLSNGKTIVASGVSISGGATGTLARLEDPSSDTVRLIGGSTSGGDVNILVSDTASDRRRSWREIRQ